MPEHTNKEHKKKFLIFALGTNHWALPAYPKVTAPGSGIVHKLHHDLLREMEADPESIVDGVYSIWPSDEIKAEAGRTDYRVLELTHQIPICESAGPTSSYRWHRMPEDEVAAYRNRLIKEVEQYIDQVEKERGRRFNVFMAHHCFVNPTVLVEINKRRVARGLETVPIVVFAHGTALKMFQNELKPELQEEFPKRFLPWMQKNGIFEGDLDNGITAVYAISPQQQKTFMDLFPKFPKDRVILAPNGYSPKTFHPIEGATRANAIGVLPQRLLDGKEGPGVPVEKHDKIVAFVGRIMYRGWKRTEVVIRAAKIYQEAAKAKGMSIGTLIIGGGPADGEEKLKNFAFNEVGVQDHVYFLGPQPQAAIAKINTVADLGVYPSKDEPFGLVFIEAMACGMPVVGAKSGGPISFVKPEVGRLIDESDDEEVLAKRLADVVIEACVDGDWKKTKRDACIQYATTNFSLKEQMYTMLEAVDDFAHHKPKGATKSGCCGSCECSWSRCVIGAIAIGVAAFVGMKLIKGSSKM